MPAVVHPQIAQDQSAFRRHSCNEFVSTDFVSKLRQEIALYTFAAGTGAETMGVVRLGAVAAAQTDVLFCIDRPFCHRSEAKTRSDAVAAENFSRHQLTSGTAALGGRRSVGKIPIWSLLACDRDHLLHDVHQTGRDQKMPDLRGKLGYDD